MVYHVIIDSLSAGQKKVEQIVFLLQKRGLERLEIRNRISQSFGNPTIGQLIFRSKLNDQEAMNFYREKLDAEVLEKKIKHFYRNNVELLFDGGEKNFDANELWEDIMEHVFDNGRESPIMFVVMTGEENGTYKPFIPDDYEE